MARRPVHGFSTLRKYCDDVTTRCVRRISLVSGKKHKRTKSIATVADDADEPQLSIVNPASAATGDGDDRGLQHLVQSHHLQLARAVRGKTFFKQLSDVLQSGGGGVGGKKDMWLVVFTSNNVMLRCQCNSSPFGKCPCKEAWLRSAPAGHGTCARPHVL